jgi:hypothetical protein
MIMNEIAAMVLNKDPAPTATVTVAVTEPSL